MTKKEYFKMQWHYEECAMRTVDSDGELIYRHCKPEIQGGCWESFDQHKLHFFRSEDVADWWRESLQTHEQYLQLKTKAMTKEEYFKTEWKYEDFDSRAIDDNGQEFYFASLPILSPHGDWMQNNEVGIRYDQDVIGLFWYESLQTKEQYLQLKKQNQ